MKFIDFFAGIAGFAEGRNQCIDEITGGDSDD